MQEEAKRWGLGPIVEGWMWGERCSSERRQECPRHLEAKRDRGDLLQRL